MKRCPCRRCNPGPLGGLMLTLAAGFTTDDRVRMVCQRYVESTPTWGSRGMTVEALEAELEELLGIVHGRHELAQLRAQAARAARRGRLARMVAP